MEPLSPRLIAVAAVAVATLGAAPAGAEPSAERPTVQHRFAPKRQSLFLHATGTTHIRNDFYDSWGVGADFGYYPWESLGFELRGIVLQTRLSAAARDVKEQTGLTPDARPQSLMLAAGPRLSLGYGKILALGRFVLHFDPQFVASAGVARAETRWLPSALAGLSLLMHFRYGIQAKIDLNTTIQAEQRERGWVTSLGFAPMLGVGWNLRLGGGDG